MKKTTVGKGIIDISRRRSVQEGMTRGVTLLYSGNDDLKGVAASGGCWDRGLASIALVGRYMLLTPNTLLTPQKNISTINTSPSPSPSPSQALPLPHSCLQKPSYLYANYTPNPPNHPPQSPPQEIFPRKDICQSPKKTSHQHVNRPGVKTQGDIIICSTPIHSALRKRK
jgi:hypothetical protein